MEGGRWKEMIHGLSRSAGNKPLFSGRGPHDPGYDFKMNLGFLVAGLLGMGVAAWAEDETSSQRLENAQRGMAEASWPRKPDNRMSSLSGKMKDITEISPRFYGQDKEFRGKEAGDWQKESGMGSRGNWVAPAGRGWEEARWNRGRDWAGAEKTDGQFPLPQELAAAKTTAYRELERESAPDWSSRSASLGAQTDGSLRMYEGRFIS